MLHHIPVLLKETIEGLDPKPGEFFVEGTVGGGGHTEAILEKLLSNTPQKEDSKKTGKFLAIDQDGEVLKKTKEIIEKKFRFQDSNFKAYWFNANFSEIKEIIQEKKMGKIDGMLLDLGFSSLQLESGLGFTFRNEEPLIMRYDGDTSGFTAARFLNEYNKDRIAEVIKKYGEESFAGRIAESIVRTRRKKPLRTTKDLVDAINEAIPAGLRRNSGERGGKTKIHPATKTFMAIRIFVNKEIESLEKILEDIPKISNKDARIAIISFHSLEDKIVKNKFKEYKKNGIAEHIGKKPIKPNFEEIRNNPRARSAKLRIMKITGNK